MMFSVDKCAGRSTVSGGAEDSELYAGGREGMGKEGVTSDDVASAVAAVSDEIGDILKDELGDADRADRIGAELADLSAELGFLAGLADGEAQPDFTSHFEVPFEWIGMGQLGSGSGSSSSSWSGARGGRPRRPQRPQRSARRRPIAKGKEASRRTARATATRRPRVHSDASDVGADSDSDDQWTELDDHSGSDSSSTKDAAAVNLDCDFHKDQDAEAPPLGQFLLPLLNTESPNDHFLIRHDDILQLLASAEESVREDMPMDDDVPTELPAGADRIEELGLEEEPVVTPEEEAALLHYVCQAERSACTTEVPESERLEPVEEWLLGVYHSWCEISALMCTLIGNNTGSTLGEWSYRARFGCHCRLCLTLSANAVPLSACLRRLVANLAHGSDTSNVAVGIARALRLHTDSPMDCTHWDLARLQRLQLSSEGLDIVHSQLQQLAAGSDTAQQLVQSVCQCRKFDRPMDKQFAMERLCKILENFKAVSTISFKVDMIPAGGEGGTSLSGWKARVARCLAPHQKTSTAARLKDMKARTTSVDLTAWAGYKHRCDCLTPRTLSSQQRKQLLRISFFGMMQAVNEINKNADKLDVEEPNDAQEPSETQDATAAQETTETQDATDAQETTETQDATDARMTIETGGTHETGEAQETALALIEPMEADRLDDLDDITDSDANSGNSLGLSTSSSLDSASELLLAAAAAVESGGSEGEAAPGELCRTVRHLMRSIASIERLMDRVLKHCDEWPTPTNRNDHEARKRVDMGLSEVDRKLMAMYRRLPEVHQRQLQVYRKQKKLSTVCMQLVGGRAPPPPPPGSPPAAAPSPVKALCPEYHLQRFREVRRKVMHMRDQQLYYHRLRMWLEDQLRNEKDSLPESTVTLVENLPRRKRRNESPKLPRLSTASKRKLKPVAPSMSKTYKILQMLKHKGKDLFKDDADVEPPEAFHLEKDTDTETVVGEKDDLCKEMKECLAKFANFAVNDDEKDVQDIDKLESVSPPLQEMSPTTTEPLPVYNRSKLLPVKLIEDSSDGKDIGNCRKDEDSGDLKELANNIGNLNLESNDGDVKADSNDLDYTVEKNDNIDSSKDKSKDGNIDNTTTDSIANNDTKNEEGKAIDDKDANIYKYVSFGIEIKRAMEECQNIINSYNSIKETKDHNKDDDGPLSLEQICEVMMCLDKNSVDFLDKLDSDEPFDISDGKLAELIESMPQILANMPEIASKLSEYANASFELPEFASIMNTLPDVNNEAQLTPETLKQIRELKLSKSRDNVKVTKHTAKRKSNRRIKNNIDTSDVLNAADVDFNQVAELLKDDKKLTTYCTEHFKSLPEATQHALNKGLECLQKNNTMDFAKYFDDDTDFFTLPKESVCAETSIFFDNSVKDALSMDELRELVKSRFNSWKHHIATKFNSIQLPMELLEAELEAVLDKYSSYIQDLAGKQCVNDSDMIIDKIDDLRKNMDDVSDSEVCVASKETLRQITKLLSTSAGNTFDLLIMKLSKMSQDKKTSVKCLKFKYMDVLRRCVESEQLAVWILLDPEIAANVIQELTGLPMKKANKVPDFNHLSQEKKIAYFMDKLKEMNRSYMETLPKNELSGDEWMVMLCRLEQLSEKIQYSFTSINVLDPPKPRKQAPSEAEILAAKGLSKIIASASKKKDTKSKDTKDSAEKEKRLKNEALLSKCEAILTSKGEKSLLDSFYTIKSYITQGLPVPETYKKHVISICSSIDAKLLNEEIEESIKLDESTDKNLSVVGSQNPEMLAKYSAQALRNAKQTLNAVAFKNMLKNGTSKSESDTCDTPKNDCKWTNDCVCSSCKDNESAVCLGDIVKYEDRGKNGLEEKKEVKKPAQKAVKGQPKCENSMHQHVCKVGHGTPNNSCLGESGADQPCSCCYCTVFGHAPPLTTPVPRNFNETRERLRSILNKKKQKCKANGELETKPIPTAAPAPASAAAPSSAATASADAPPTRPRPAPQPAPAQPQPQPQPPALPKTLPPALSTAQQQAIQQKRAAAELQQKQLAEKMAKMVVSDKTDKPKALQRTVPVQVNMPTAVKTEGKVNPNAMEQIRMQQLKQQQMQQLKQQQLQQQQQQQAQKKPEPIYDLPIHNKPTLTPLQQAQIRQQQLQQQLQRQQQEFQQRHGRPPQRAVSLSSRDTSVFSTSSGCDNESCWRNSRAEDPRDLDALLQYIEGPARHVDRGKKKAKKQRQKAKRDALLQYIEGPARHVDRGKKKAKKQRQKAKRTEAKLADERSEIAEALGIARQTLASRRSAHLAAKRRLDDLKKALAHHNKNKKKGKKSKLNPVQQAKVQQLSEQLAELTALITSQGKEVQEYEKQVNEYSNRLLEVDRELNDARAVMGKVDTSPNEQAIMETNQALLEAEQIMLQKQQQQAAMQARAMELQRQRVAEQQRQHMQQLQQQQLQQQQLQQQQLQQQQLQQHRQLQLQLAREKQLRDAAHAQLSAAGQHPTPVQRLLANNSHLIDMNEVQSAAQKAKEDKKQTWEQALAHINQIAKGQGKEKKKQKEAARAEAKQKAPQRSQSLPDETQALSKKQRKLLAKQQAEEEERRRKEAEEKARKAEAKKEAKDAKKDKKEKKQEPVKSKKEEKREQKKEKVVEKKKETKADKTAPQPSKQKGPPAGSQPAQKKDKKKEQKAPPSAATAPASVAHDNAMHVVGKKMPGIDDKPASCSIMEQLSCGVQVADLRLPPGITLTRVQPSEKKEPPPIKSVPLWKCNQLPAAPTPVARPQPVINADPSMMVFSTAQPEPPPKTIIVPEPAPAPKSKKAKKKAKKAASAAEEPKTDGTKMVTLRNPMFHPNLPAVQISNPAKKPEQIRIPDPIPMPPNACQATITPTSNGMYTIRNPLMSMVHQQATRNQTPTAYVQPQYNYVNPNVYVQNAPQQTYVIDPSRSSPKAEEYQSRIMNLASFTQKNDEGYSLFKTPEDNSISRNFLTPEYYAENQSKSTVSPNPIGTRPETNRFEDTSIRTFDDSSLFANPVQRPEPIGTPMKREEDVDSYSSLYTPFGREDRNVFRNALFNDKNEKMDDIMMANGDPLPYFQRLRVGSKLNNEVTIHHVTESKFYKGQDSVPFATSLEESLFSRPSGLTAGGGWPEGLYGPNPTINGPPSGDVLAAGDGPVAPVARRACEPDYAHANNRDVHGQMADVGPAHARDESGYGAVGERHKTDRPKDSSVFLPDGNITNLTTLDASERDIESFKRFDFYFDPPAHKPRVQLQLGDIAAALRQNHK